MWGEPVDTEPIGVLEQEAPASHKAGENVTDLDVLSATFAITHLYSGFNPNHHVIVRAHESYTDPPAPVIDSINNRQLRQSGGTRYLEVSRTVLDKEKQ